MTKAGASLVIAGHILLLTLAVVASSFPVATFESAAIAMSISANRIHIISIVAPFSSKIFFNWTA
jgi:hypothetical protein